MHRQENKHEKGQSLTEFALALPILILILSGLIDIGRAYFAYIFLEEAAAEAAQYAALHPLCVIEDSANFPECDDPNNGEWRANNSGSKQGIIVADSIDICMYNPTTQVCEVYNATLGLEVYILATVDFSFITPGISAMAEGVTGSSILTLRVVASNTVITK